MFQHKIRRSLCPPALHLAPDLSQTKLMQILDVYFVSKIIIAVQLSKLQTLFYESLSLIKTLQ